MINLLSPQAQESLRREYLRRRRVLSGSLVLFCLLAMIALLGTIIWQVRAQASEVEQRLVNEATSPEDAELERELIQTNAELELFRSRTNLPTLSALRELISSQQPGGVELKSWDYLAGSETPALLLTGQASDRATLLAFEKALRETKVFVNVESPVSNLIKSQNPEFTLKLSLKHGE